MTFRSGLDDGEKIILCSAFPIMCRVIYGAHAINIVTPPFNIESGKAEAVAGGFSSNSMLADST